MTKEHALVRDNMLLISGQVPVPLGSPEWYSWLEQASSFRYEHNDLRFGARRERFQRGGWYWRAYRRVAGKLRRSYLGRTADLSPERLYQVALRLDADTTHEGLPPVLHAKHRVNFPEAIPEQPFSLRPGIAPLLQSKLRPPDLRRATVLRSRLLERLEAAFQHRLLLIVTPPGWGKTTLLAQAVQARPEAALVWLSLDEADNEPLRFWSYVLSGLAQVEDALVPAALALQTTLQPRLDYILAQLINTLMHDTSPAPRIVLGLDDYHVINEPAIHTALEMLIEQIPERLHVVIASRSIPPFPMARWRAAGYVYELRAPDLRFSIEEGRQLLSSVLAQPLEYEQVAGLIEQAQGWAAGLHLAGLALRSEGEQALAKVTEQWLQLHSAGHPFIVDYLIMEILRQQPEPIQTFLLRTSILERLSAELCAELCAHPHAVHTGDIEAAQAILQSLERDNMFVMVLDQQRQWYRYHQLFADALRTHLRQQDPELYYAVHRTAMYWYERKVAEGDSDLIHAAIEHGLAAVLYVETARLLSKESEYIFWVRGELHSLLRWLKIIPRTVFSDYPDLILLEAWAQLVSVNLEAVEDNLREIVRRDDLRFAADVASLRSFILRLHGDLAGSIELCYLALARMPQHPSPLRYLTNMHLVSNYILNGEIHLASSSLERLIEESRGWTVPPKLMLLAGSHLLEAALLLIKGCPRESKQRIESSMLSTQGSLRSGGPQGSNALAMSEACYALGELDQAEQWARLAAEQGQNSWNSDILSHAYYLQSRVARARGNRELARDLFQRMSSLFQDYKVPHITRSIELSAAWDALQDGDTGPATQAIFQRGFQEDGPIRGDQFDEYELMARLALVEQRWESALKLGQRLHTIAHTNGHVMREMSMERLKVLVLAGAGRQQEALALLGALLQRSLETGMIQPVLDEGEPMRSLIKAYLRSLNHAPELQQMLRRLLSQFPPVGDRPEQSESMLTAREREVLGLLRAGHSNRQIAAALVVSLATVKKHLSSIFTKLGVTRRSELLK